MDLLDAALKCLNDWWNLSETDALHELCVIGIQVVTELTPTVDICQVFCICSKPCVKELEAFSD